MSISSQIWANDSEIAWMDLISVDDWRWEGVWQDWRELGYAYPVDGSDCQNPKMADAMRHLDIAERMQESENE